MFLKLLARITKNEKIIDKWLKSVSDDVYLNLSSSVDIVTVQYEHDEIFATFIITYSEDNNTKSLLVKVPFDSLTKTPLPVYDVSRIFIGKRMHRKLRKLIK